jgi:hypothetical protein
MKFVPTLLWAISIASLSSTAFAQDMPVPADPQSRDVRYNVQEMNFDMWCQEEQHLPPDRCDKRLPADDEAFNAYRSKIERYEIPYLQKQQRQIDISRDILHNDPIDDPGTPTKQGQTPAGSAAPPSPK